MSAARPGIALFAYGSLMLAEVMEIVAGRRFASRRAVLAGYDRRALHDEVYPAIVPAAGARVEGVLWEGLDRAALGRVDRFEGALYERQRCRVAAAGGARVRAEVYVLAPAERGRLSAIDWDEAAFRTLHLTEYLASCRAFAREHEASAPRDQVEHE